MATANQQFNDVKWLSSQKGKYILSVDDYLFDICGNGKTPGVRYWKCSNLKTTNCTVTAQTVDAVLISVNGIDNPPDHGHANDAERIPRLNFKV